MGTRPPSSTSPTSPRQASAPLQCNVEDDVFGGGNAAVGLVYRGQGRQMGGERCSLPLLVIMLLLLLLVVVIVVQKKQIIKDGVGPVIRRADVV